MRNVTRILLTVLGTSSVALTIYRCYIYFMVDQSNPSARASQISNTLITTSIIIILFFFLNLVIIISLFKYIDPGKKAVTIYMLYSLIMYINGIEILFVSTAAIVILILRILLHSRRKGKGLLDACKTDF